MKHLFGSQVFNILVKISIFHILCTSTTPPLSPTESPFIRLSTNKPIIAIIGTGYVGLVSGACLAHLNNSVICADIDSQKIKQLNNNIIPIFEPGLQEIVSRNASLGRLLFTDQVDWAIQRADVIFIAVDTPLGDNGAANMYAFESVLNTIIKNLNGYKIIVTKSTVPIGTGTRIREYIISKGIPSDQFDVVSNPEFLREGSAVQDFLFPDRLVIGAESDAALATLCKVYEEILKQQVPYVFTNITSAETIKYASNAFLATKLSFINEIANLCDKTGADIQTVSYAMGLDHRISPQFLKPGPGFGGSCFPKDTQALLFIAQQYGIHLHTVQAALTANNLQKEVPIQKLLHLIHKDEIGLTLKGKTITVLGLAFKSNTDDIRYSPAITTIQKLLDLGATVNVYDPAANANMQRIFPSINYFSCLYEAVTKADGIIIMTEWDEFKQIDLERVASLVNNRVIVDARNILNPVQLKDLGFEFDCIGKSYLSTVHQPPLNMISRCIYIQ